MSTELGWKGSNKNKVKNYQCNYNKPNEEERYKLKYLIDYLKLKKIKAKVSSRGLYISAVKSNGCGTAK